MQAADNVMCLYRYCNDANEGEGTSCLIMYINTHWLAVPSLNAGEGEGGGEGKRERERLKIAARLRGLPPGNPPRLPSLLPIHQPLLGPSRSSLFRATERSSGAEAKGWSPSAKPDVPAAARHEGVLRRQTLLTSLPHPPPPKKKNLAIQKAPKKHRQGRTS